MISKKCKKCKTEKPSSEFYSHKQTKDKLDTMCKLCKKEEASKWAVNNKEKRREISKRYVQKNPEKRKETSKKYYQANKEETFFRVKSVRAKNPEKYAELGRIHAHRRRARKFENGTEPYTEQMVMEAYGTDCHICNEPIDLEAPRRVGVEGWERGLQLDHVLPLSRGGDDRIENLRPAHGLCNLRKTNTI